MLIIMRIRNTKQPSEILGVNIDSPRKFEDNIDQLAELDSGLFWPHINNCRKKSSNKVNSNGKTVWNEREITNEWAKYFKTLYTPLDNKF